MDIEKGLKEARNMEEAKEAILKEEAGKDKKAEDSLECKNEGKGV